MKFSKTLLAGSVAAAMAVSSFAPVANAEVAASVGIASTYLWRGYDLGTGVPAVSGDLSYSAAGFYTGVWASSGDTEAGTEYDLYVGYGAEFGDFSVDASVWNYNYPTGAGYLDDEDTVGIEETDFGQLSDFVLGLGYGPVAVTYYDNIAGGSGSSYITLGLSVDKYSLTIGQHNSDGDDSPTHINLDYAFNDNLTFTLSQFVADEDIYDDGTKENDLKVVVSYSLPL